MDKSLILIAGMSCVAASANADDKRPNILWLTYEDTSPTFIGCYGNVAAKTPNMDALAKSGVRFDAAFSTGAVSSPSRFCLITGVKAFSAGNGHHRSAYPVPQGWECFPYYLRQAGYYTSNNSKTDYNIADSKTFINKAWNECSGKADWRGRKAGQPFFAVYNSPSSHQSRTMTDPWSWYEKKVLNLLDESEKSHAGNLPMPDIYLNSPQMQKNISRVYNSITKTDKEFGEWLGNLGKDGLRDSTIIFCFSDHGEGIPRGKCSPVAMGHQVPFIVWIPPMYAHLSPYGSGIITQEIVSFEDFAPTVLSLAGVDIPQYMEGKPFMGAKRETPKKYFFGGVDRAGENTDLSRTVSDGRYLYVRNFMPYQPLVRPMMYFDVADIQKQIRSDYADGKLNLLQASILEPRETEYLYDIKEDKWETVNLVSDRRHAKRLSDMRKVLYDNVVKSRDAGFIPESMVITAARRGIAPYDLRKDEQLYPVEKVIEAAFLVGNGAQVIDRHLAAVSDKNQILQYWGAIGLFSQKERLKKYTKTIEALYAKTKYSLTKVYLLATLIDRCGEYKYMNDFFCGIGHSYPEVERLTLQLIMAMDDTVQQASMPFIDKRMLDKGVSPSCKDWCKLLIHKVRKEPLEDLKSNY